MVILTVIGEVDIGWNEGYESPKFFVQGMKVIVPVGPDKAVWATVQTAAGDSARVVSEDALKVSGQCSRWVRLADVCVVSEERYEKLVSEHMKRTYGLTWADACGESSMLVEARCTMKPKEFVMWYGEKYDLTPISEMGLVAGG
jgi:hypothetical protein